MAEHQMTRTRLQAMKRRAEKIVMVTAYDYPTASLVGEAGVDLVLVGDSVGMAVLVETVAKTDSTFAAGGDRNWKLSGASTRASTESGDKELNYPFGPT